MFLSFYGEQKECLLKMVQKPVKVITAGAESCWLFADVCFSVSCPGWELQKKEHWFKKENDGFISKDFNGADFPYNRWDTIYLNKTVACIGLIFCSALMCLLLLYQCNVSHSARSFCIHHFKADCSTKLHSQTGFRFQ